MLKGQTKGSIPKEERTTLRCKDCNNDLSIDNFTVEGKTSSGRLKYRSRCKECYRQHSIDNHVNSPSRLFEYAKSMKTKCVVCGYDRCRAALEFHHLDPNIKDGSISQMVRERVDLKVLKKEIKKCVVICNRCHREHHNGLIVLKTGSD